MWVHCVNVKVPIGFFFPEKPPAVLFISDIALSLNIYVCRQLGSLTFIYNSANASPFERIVAVSEDFCSLEFVSARTPEKVDSNTSSSFYVTHNKFALKLTLQSEKLFTDFRFYRPERHTLIACEENSNRSFTFELSTVAFVLQRRLMVKHLAQ